MTSATEKRLTVQPFGVQVDHPSNCDLMLQSIPGCRLRSKLGAIRSEGDRPIPMDASRHYAMFPAVPGMELHINPAKLVYVVSDPLLDDEDMCERIKRTINQMGGAKMDRIRGVDTVKGTLDVHRMKTLCREIIWFQKQDAIKAVKGVIPTMEDVEGMPGNFLLNPGSQVYNTQPKFEKDWDKWVERLTASGG